MKSPFWKRSRSILRYCVYLERSRKEKGREKNKIKSSISPIERNLRGKFLILTNSSILFPPKLSKKDANEVNPSNGK